MEHIEKIFSVMKSIKDSNFSEKDTLHQYRLQTEPFIYKALNHIYGEHFHNFWNSTEIPAVADKAIVFVERRCHPNLEFCLKNAAYFARGYAIHIFCSKANAQFVKLICGKQPVHIHEVFDSIGTPEQGKTEYNNLLKTYDFWNSLSEEHILTMETDCYLMRSVDDSMFSYDFVGAKWPWMPEDAGGGGLTYRKNSVMKKICKLTDETLLACPMQDCFMTLGLKLIEAKVPTYEEAENYFTESEVSQNCMGTHQWWTFMGNHSDDILKQIIMFYLVLRV